MKFVYLTPAAVLLAAFLTACSSAPKTAEKPVSTSKTNGKLFAVAVDDAAFFRRGPQAGREPDQKLSKETLVRLIRPSFGYSKVELVASREQGYVSSDEIKPATSGLIAAFAPPKVDPLSATTPTPAPEPAGEQFNLNSSDPRLVPPPEDLPPTELPLPPSGE
ncbi:MAG TPA: hypothetical protein VM940_12850 [Chthoniobacterales bacterium]|nr:hypothetical protein [Chthoniobacterales bacterium]